jgi:carbamoyltransferase
MAHFCAASARAALHVKRASAPLTFAAPSPIDEDSHPAATGDRMYTLGINAAFHDCSACLVEDGVVLAASEEERYTRIKHGKRPLPFTTWQLPYHAIDDCLRQAGISLRDVAHVAYSYDPSIELGESTGPIMLPLEPSAAGETASPWEALALCYIVNAPRQLAGGAPLHLRRRFLANGAAPPYRWHFVEHHRAHEASAFLAAPMEECAVLVLDGRGERASTSYGVFSGGRYERIGQVCLPHSLGLLYEDITAHLGFLHSSDEYKVMALAAFGQPRFAPQLRDIVRYRGDGDYTVAPVRWPDVLGPPRLAGAPLEQRHRDIACSLQIVLQETMDAIAAWLHRRSGMDQLAMAGGVALNCVMNGALRKNGPFRRIWVQPAAGDAGTALGAALWVDHEQRGAPGRRWTMQHAYLGPAFDDDAIEAALRESLLSYRRVDDIAGAAARLLAQGKVLGWFQGRMEFGPRALGARSILASPIDAAMQQRLNRIKDREDFRPVAPVVPEEAAADWFEDGSPSPYMLFAGRVRTDKAVHIPAACHIDGSARLQTIAPAQNALLHRLLTAFGERTGVPVLINTSFNTRGQPVVCTPRDALAAYCTSAIDALAIGSFLLEKQP